MCTRSVSKRAWRKPGISMMIILLGLIALQRGKAADVNITVTGVLTGGWDTKALFFQGSDAKNLAGKPFTLVFTFDDSKGHATNSKCDSGRSGGGAGSPGVAVLTLGNGSFKFGGSDNFESGVFRACDGSMLSMSVNRKPSSSFDMTLGVNVRVVPSGTSHPLAIGSDWTSPMSATDIESRSSCFNIADRMNGGKEVKACFEVKKVEIGSK